MTLLLVYEIFAFFGGFVCASVIAHFVFRQQRLDALYALERHRQESGGFKLHLCQAEHDGYRCYYPKGHLGRHYNHVFNEHWT